MKLTMGTVLAILLVALLGLLLYPLESAQFAIEFDEAAIARKEAFLDEVRAETDASERKPNVLILLADDLGRMDVSLYGREGGIATPNIDALGERGAVFTEAYATSPTCSPSRAAMLTGRYQQRFGYETQLMSRYVRNPLEYLAFKYLIDIGDWRLVDIGPMPQQRDINRQGLPPSEITLGELLQANGYRTGLLGKWHLGYNAPFLPRDRGFDYTYGFLEAFSLHTPLDVPGIVEHRLGEFDDDHQWRQERTGPSALRRNGEVVEDEGYLTFTLADECIEQIEAAGDDPFALVVSFSTPHQPFQAPQEYYDRFAHIPDHGERVYAAMVAALDDAVGQIVAKVEDLGLMEDTLIWFASDNGAAAYTGAVDNAPLKGGKFNYFEGGVNVPMTLTWEGHVEAGTTYDAPVSLMDIFQTSVAAAGSPLPDDRVYDGVDLVAALKGGGSAPARDAIYWRTHVASGIRQGDWKLLLDGELNRKLLYNLASDKEESTDLAAAYPAVVEHLEETLERWDSELQVPRWPRLMDYHFFIDGVDFHVPI